MKQSETVKCNHFRGYKTIKRIDHPADPKNFIVIRACRKCTEFSAFELDLDAGNRKLLVKRIPYEVIVQ